MLDLAGLRAWIDDHHSFDLLRVQTLRHYAVGEDLDRYIRGEDGPEPKAKAAWLDRLRTLTAAGRRWRIVHALETPLSPYLRYACEWGYAQNVPAGQDIRILDMTGRDNAADIATVGDFYVADQQHVLLMHYADDGSFLGAEPITEKPRQAMLRVIADLAWQHAEPFAPWWNTHTEFHRDAHQPA